MKIEDWESVGTLPPLYRELQQLGLEENIAELDAFGYTIIPPEKVAPPEFLRDVRQALLRVAEQRLGSPVDAEGGTTHTDMIHPLGQVVRFMLWDDPIFEKLVLNPAALGLVQYLVGTNCILGLCDASIKGPGNMRTPIHVDWADFSVNSFPAEPMTANFNYLLSDYSKEDGALSFIPGSHRWRRFPSPEESAAWADKAQPVEAPAGSMVVWGSHTWHGSFPRTTPGLRMMIVGLYARPHLQAQEPFRETCTQEALDRNPVRFASLMDQYGMFPFGKPDVDLKHTVSSPSGHPRRGVYCSLFDDEPAAGKVSARPQYDYLDETPPDYSYLRAAMQAQAAAAAAKS